MLESTKPPRMRAKELAWRDKFERKASTGDCSKRARIMENADWR
jgi:hypothetical protein